MPAAKDKISCPDCLSNNVKISATSKITNSLTRRYYDCQCCGAGMRGLFEGGRLVDLELIRVNTSAVNLVLLAIKRLDRREQAEIKRFVDSLEFPLVSS